MNISKTIVGWVLLVAGVALIVWALVASYNIFLGKNQIPGIFTEQNMPKVSSTDLSQTSDTQAQLQKMLQEQLKNLIPADAISKILNLSVWSLLAFIFIFAGTKIAELGIKLLKKE
jgi:hypothetical protein